MAKLHVLEAPKNSLVGCVVRLPFRQFFDSSRTKLNKCQWHHFECAQEERAAFLYVFMKAGSVDAVARLLFFCAENER